jgi:propionate CoA-transferase
MHEGAPLPDDERPLTADVIASRRAVLEMHRGGVYNFGLGMPARDVIPATIDEEIDQEVTLSIETGVLGGQVNGLGFRSGVTSILDTPGIFSLYATKVMDGTFLSMLEFDRAGNVNLLRYGDTIVGPGGSMDIAQHNPKITFLGTFRAGGLAVECIDGSLRIVEEGSHPRAVEQVQAISFNGPMMHAAGKEVLYVTERAVFRLTEDGPMLIEAAPGIDVERDILACMAFRPAIAETVHTMDARIFRPGPLGLRADWGLAPIADRP